MALSAFGDRSRPPETSALDAALGRSRTLWRRLAAETARRHPPIEEAWHFAGEKFGWSLRLARNGRNVLYLIPQAGSFLVGVVLGERAVAAARGSALPAAVMEMLDAARPYAEGRGIRVPVRTRADLDAVLELLRLKLGG